VHDIGREGCKAEAEAGEPMLRTAHTCATWETSWHSIQVQGLF
jgi:hypothetical protein